MRHAHPERAIEAEFRKQAENLSEEISHFGKSLKSLEEKIRLDSIGDIKESQEKGPHYLANILPYLDGIDGIKINNQEHIRQLADRVTSSIHFAKSAIARRKYKLYRRDSWLELNSALVFLGGRPSKKFSSLLLFEDKLLEWDVNHLCHGIPRQAVLYEKGAAGDRGYHLWCAERNTPAKFLGIAAATPDSEDRKVIHAAIDRFTPSLIGAAMHHEFLEQCTLVSSHYPCVPCADVLAPAAEKGSKNRLKIIGELIAYWDERSEDSFTGSRETVRSQRIIRRAGITENLRVLRS